MSEFTEDQFKEAIEQNTDVQSSVNKIREACQKLQEKTGCPNEDVDDLLNFMVGRWQ